MINRSPDVLKDAEWALTAGAIEILRTRELGLDGLEICNVRKLGTEHYQISVRHLETFQPTDVPEAYWTATARTRLLNLHSGRLTCPCPTGVLLLLPCRHIFKVLSGAGVRLQHTDLHIRWHNLFLTNRLVVERNPADCHYVGVRPIPQLLSFLDQLAQDQSPPAEDQRPGPAEVGQSVSDEEVVREEQGNQPARRLALYHRVQELAKLYLSAMGEPLVGPCSLSDVACSRGACRHAPGPTQRRSRQTGTVILATSG